MPNHSDNSDKLVLNYMVQIYKFQREEKREADKSCSHFPSGRCPSICIGHGLGAHVCGIAGLSRAWLAELNEDPHMPTRGHHTCPGGNKGEGTDNKSIHFKSRNLCLTS